MAPTIDDKLKSLEELANLSKTCSIDQSMDESSETGNVKEESVSENPSEGSIVSPSDKNSTENRGCEGHTGEETLTTSEKQKSLEELVDSLETCPTDKSTEESRETGNLKEKAVSENPSEGLIVSPLDKNSTENKGYEGETGEEAHTTSEKQKSLEELVDSPETCPTDKSTEESRETSNVKEKSVPENPSEDSFVSPSDKNSTENRGCEGKTDKKAPTTSEKQKSLEELIDLSETCPTDKSSEESRETSNLEEESVSESPSLKSLSYKTYSDESVDIKKDTCKNSEESVLEKDIPSDPLTTSFRDTQEIEFKIKDNLQNADSSSSKSPNMITFEDDETQDSIIIPDVVLPKKDKGRGTFPYFDDNLNLNFGNYIEKSPPKIRKQKTSTSVPAHPTTFEPRGNSAFVFEIDSDLLKTNKNSKIFPQQKEDNELPGMKRTAFKNSLKRQIEERRIDAFKKFKETSTLDEELVQAESSSSDADVSQELGDERDDELGDERDDERDNELDEHDNELDDEHDNELDDELGDTIKRRKVRTLDESSDDSSSSNSVELVVDRQDNASKPFKSIGGDFGTETLNDSDENSTGFSNTCTGESQKNIMKDSNSSSPNLGITLNNLSMGSTSQIFGTQDLETICSGTFKNIPEEKKRLKNNPERCEDSKSNGIYSDIDTDDDPEDPNNKPPPEVKNAYIDCPDQIVSELHHFNDETSQLPWISDQPDKRKDIDRVEPYFDLDAELSSDDSGDEVPEGEDDNDGGVEDLIDDADLLENRETVVQERMLEEYFDLDAEISSDDSGDEILEGEDDKDGGVEGLIDDDDLPENRETVVRAHLKNIKEDDDEMIEQYKERFLPEGDLHSDGSGRIRQFAWKSIVDPDITKKNECNSDSDDTDEDTVTAMSRKKEKLVVIEDTEEIQLPEVTPNSTSKIRIIKKPDMSLSAVRSSAVSRKRIRGSYMEVDQSDLVKKIKLEEDDCGSRSTKHFVFRKDGDDDVLL